MSLALTQDGTEQFRLLNRLIIGIMLPRNDICVNGRTLKASSCLNQCITAGLLALKDF